MYSTVCHGHSAPQVAHIVDAGHVSWSSEGLLGPSDRPMTPPTSYPVHAPISGPHPRVRLISPHLTAPYISTPHLTLTKSSFLKSSHIETSLAPITMSARTDEEASQTQLSSGITPTTLETSLREKLSAEHVDIQDLSGTDFPPSSYLPTTQNVKE